MEQSTGATPSCIWKGSSFLQRYRHPDSPLPYSVGAVQLISTVPFYCVDDWMCFYSLHHRSDKPQLRASLPSGTITIKVGHPLELDCSAVGRPSPSYVWTHQDNARSFSNTSVYSIKSVRFGDEGLYTCTANNSMGAFSVSFKVDVEGECDCFRHVLFWECLLMRHKCKSLSV